MKSVVGRRVFVGSVVAGLPLVAGIGARTFAQSRPGAEHQHPGGAGGDPVLEHLFREMAAIHNRARHEPRGEDARAFAAQLRTLVVYARQQHVDDRIREAARAAIQREGRQGLLWRDPDPVAMRAELERYGVEIDARAQDLVPPPGYVLRNQALDMLLRDGISASWDRVARLLERAAPEIDRQQRTVIRVSLAQDAEWKEGFCEQLWKEVQLAEAAALLQCAMVGIPIIGEAFTMACLGAQLAAATLLLAYRAAQC